MHSPPRTVGRSAAHGQIFNCGSVEDERMLGWPHVRGGAGLAKRRREVWGAPLVKNPQQASFGVSTHTDPPPSPAGGSEEATGADASPSLETFRRGRARRRPASTLAGDKRAVKRWRSDECHELLKWLQQTSDHRATLQERNDVKGLNAQYQAAADHLAGRFPQYTGYTDARVKSKARYLQTSWKGVRQVINAERSQGAGTERIETLQGAFALLLSLLTPFSTCVPGKLWLDSNSVFPRRSCIVRAFPPMSGQRSETVK